MNDNKSTRDMLLRHVENACEFLDLAASAQNADDGLTNAEVRQITERAGNWTLTALIDSLRNGEYRPDEDEPAWSVDEYTAHDVLDNEGVRLDDLGHAMIEDYFMDVVVRKGEPARAVITVGGPNIYLVFDEFGGGPRIEGYWGLETVTRRSWGVNYFAESLAEDYGMGDD